MASQQTKQESDKAVLAVSANATNVKEGEQEEEVPSTLEAQPSHRINEAPLMEEMVPSLNMAVTRKSARLTGRSKQSVPIDIVADVESSYPAVSESQATPYPTSINLGAHKMFTRSMARKRRDTSTPEAAVISFKRQRQPDPTMSSVVTLNNSILNAVINVDPGELLQSISMKTRQGADDLLSDKEVYDIYARLILPSDEIYHSNRKNLIACLRIVLDDCRFALPFVLTSRALSDKRQLTEIVKVLFEQRANNSITSTLSAAFASIVARNDRVLKVIIDQPGFVVNQALSIGTLRLLNFAMLVVGDFTKDPSGDCALVLLGHSDIKPDCRTLSSNTGVWKTALSVAHDAYARAKNGETAQVATRHVQHLLRRDDVDMHSMQGNFPAGYAILAVDEIMVPANNVHVGDGEVANVGEDVLL